MKRHDGKIIGVSAAPAKGRIGAKKFDYFVKAMCELVVNSRIYEFSILLNI